MKKIYLFIIFVFIATIFISCEKDRTTNVNINYNQSGFLRIKTINPDNSVLPGAAVTLFDENGTLFHGITNNYGLCEAGYFLQNSYECTASIEKDGKKYMDSKYFQIISGQEKEIVLDPFSNSGKVILKLKFEYNNTPATGLNVSLIPEDDYYTYNSIGEYLQVAQFTGKVDVNSQVVFEDVPADLTYVAIIYNNDLFMHSNNTPHIVATKDIEKTYKIIIFAY
ncbi:MAG: hypothetical protein LBQ22_11255 [Bacteroidales bacterium]|jgi:hypothetical protein|nr:hypothetical protein [Bacteroidales bacterium]